MDLLFLIALILFSGVLAMAEMAIGVSRPAILEKMAREGSSGARTVLKLREKPSRLLAGTQLGLTAVAMISGVVGESHWVPRLEILIGDYLPWLAHIKYGVSLGIVVVIITFVSLVLGEVIPKRIAIAQPEAPEAVASFMAGFVTWLLRLTAPVVALVAIASEFLLKLTPLIERDKATATDEILVLIEIGRREGNLNKTESEILGNVFRLDNRRVGAIMTPAASIVCLDLSWTPEENIKVLRDHKVSRFLLCKEGIANPIGFVESREILGRLLAGEALDLKTLQSAPLHYVPGEIALTGLLEFFKQNSAHAALVVNEFGSTEGLVTVSDLMSTVIGDMLLKDDIHALAVKREDGSWLVDGLLPVDEMKQKLGIPSLPDDEPGNFQTVGGFMLFQMGRIPRKADSFECAGWRFEVVDMDKNRVDEVLAKQLPK
jgi:putative hemolysin